MLFDFVGHWTEILALLIEACAAIIVGIAAIQAVARIFMALVQPNQEQNKEDIRLKFGRWLALALEFELAGDILRTTIAPTWNEVELLAAIVVLRTALNFFLEREIDQADRRKSAAVIP